MSTHGVVLLEEMVKPESKTIIISGDTSKGVTIMTAAFEHFPVGNAGQHGALAAEPSALINSGFQQEHR